jgi:MinD-like ATPase involved in chromosome partitioning or flagellar assembly
MSRIISVHSFRGGTGKSNTSANLGALMAQDGLRVGVVDTDIQSPGIHVLFGLDQAHIEHSLNDYLWGKCDIEQAAHDVTANLRGDIRGKVFLIPSSIKAGEIARIIREGYDVGLLNDGFQRLVSELQLDVLLIDTHPGVGEETLLSIAISDALVILMRPDHQDYQGTGVTVEIGRKLGVPRMVLLVNKCPSSFSSEDVKQQVETTFNCEVVAVVPHSDEMMTLASQGVFAAEYPDSPITQQYRQVVRELLR